MTTQTSSSNSERKSVLDEKAKSNENDTQPEVRPVTFHRFQTSAKIISIARGNILVTWDPLTEDGAEKFIKTIPTRDNRHNFVKSRFRLLVIQNADIKASHGNFSLLRTAKAKGWITNGFETFMRNRTIGSAVQEIGNSLTFIAQTPQDDDFPLFSLSLASHHALGYENTPDWTCLVFLGSSNPKLKLDVDILKDLLTREPYPNDYTPLLSPDFMVLPVCLLRWQVDEIAVGVVDLKKSITHADKDVSGTQSLNISYLSKIKESLFKLRRRQGMLHQRYVFAKELVVNLEKAFEKLKKRNGHGPEVPAAEYSEILAEAVQTQSFNLESLKHDIETAPQRIEAQQTMIDSQTSIIIARNSERTAEEARRDSASMKTIAIVTLVFLPGTFVAAVFSMSMFNWMPDDNGGGSNSGGSSTNSAAPEGKGNSQLVSSWLWLYWAITAPLTIVIVIVWMIWYSWSEKRHKKKREQEGDEEMKIK